MDRKRLREGLTRFLEGLEVKELGGDPDRLLQNLEQLWGEVLLAGYQEDPAGVLRFREPARGSDPVYITHLPYVSLCKDHLLPFAGTVSVGYLPGREVVGLSNVGRLVQVLSQRLQTQEGLTQQIAEIFFESLRPQIVGVYVTAEQFCMKMRYPAQLSSQVVTTCFRGTDPEGRFQQEFLRVVQRGLP